MTKKEIETAIRDYFGDMSRSAEETKGDLKDLELLCFELGEAIDVEMEG